MSTPAQPGVAFYNSQIAASREMAEAMFRGTAQAEKLVLEAARQAFEAQIKFAQALAAVRDPQGYATLQETFFGHSPDTAIEYQKALMQVMTETGAAFSRALETSLKGVQQEAEEETELAAPTNGNPFASFFPMWENAFKEFTAQTTGLMHMPAPVAPARARPTAAAKPRPARKR